MKSKYQSLRHFYKSEDYKQEKKVRLNSFGQNYFYNSSYKTHFKPNGYKKSTFSRHSLGPARVRVELLPFFLFYRGGANNFFGRTDFG